MWKNWSGAAYLLSLQSLKKPSTDEEVAEIVGQASLAGKIVRIVGAGHSSSSLVETNDILVSLEKFKVINEEIQFIFVSYVIAIKRSSALFVILWGYFFLNEKENIKTKLSGILIILSGLAMIVLSQAK